MGANVLKHLFMRAIHLSSKLRPRSTLPLFTCLHIPNGCDPLFSLKINGEVLWKWREFKTDPTQMFHALQNGLASIDYKLNSSSEVP